MEGQETFADAGKPATELVSFRESFETFNNIINNLQRQYLSLEQEHRARGRRLEEINRQLRDAITSSREVTIFLNSILNSLATGVVAVDTAGVISHFNPAAEKVTGAKADQALGKKYDEIIAASAGGRFSALDTVLSGAEFESEEKVIVNRAGEKIPVSVSTTLLKGDDGRRAGAVEIFFDLTKIKRLEEEIGRIRTLAALGEMAATVAHEVRNPLGGIGGFAALLRRELEGDEAKLRLVDKIITGVDNLNQTVVSLLDYTRRDQLNLRDVSLERLIQESVEYEQAGPESQDAGGSSRPNITIDILVGDRNLKVKCDPHLMRQVFLNLMRNSREAMPEGGRITIMADRETASEASPHPSPAVWIEVEDTGVGINPEIRDKIFRPFFTTKSRRRGAGLGLATVWKTVQAHGGEITVSSEMGKGSTFRICLPQES